MVLQREGGTEFLDMTNGFNPDSLTEWGSGSFNGPDGIVATAQCATVHLQAHPSRSYPGGAFRNVE
jgi:mannan endo-1,4-beta-mannosidase